MSLFVHKVDISQYVLLLAGNKLKNQVGQEEAGWLEAASVHAGPIISDICLEEDDSNVNPADQKAFLEKHDKKTQRLWFLWQRDKARGTLRGERDGCCGCVGGCNFFGKNVNGPVFFKLDYLDAGQEEKEGRLFGSPDGWQNVELDEDDDAFIENQASSKTIQRHNSWSGQSRSPKLRRFSSSQRSARTFRCKGDASRTNIPSYATFPVKGKEKGKNVSGAVMMSLRYKMGNAVGHYSCFYISNKRYLLQLRLKNITRNDDFLNECSDFSNDCSYTL